MSTKKRKKQMSWQVDEVYVNKVRKEAKKRNVAAQAIVQEALKEYFDKE